MATTGGREGLTASVTKLATTLVAIVKTRLELLGNEAQTEKLRVLRMLLLTQAMMFSALVTVLLAAAFLTLWLWEFRLGVLALCMALFGICAWMAYRALMRMVEQPASPFATSLSELQEDLRRLQAASGHAAKVD
jgi:uncharacterized membrane protein YqjE